MVFSSGSSTPRNPFASAAPLAHRPLSSIAATIAGGVTQRRIQRMLAELLPVLEALHHNGRICGDISVHSVGLDETGHAHLMALDSHVDSAERLRRLTSGYAPFELYTESSDWPLGPWTDVYAVSAVVYSLVSGQCPPAAIERRIQDPYRPLTQMGLTQYSVAFLQGIDAGLSLKPADRPQTMQTYAESLGLAVLSEVDSPLDEVLHVLPVGKAVENESARKYSVRAMINMIFFGIATLGVITYWWHRLASESEQVITSSEPMAPYYPNIDATPPFVAIPITPTFRSSDGNDPAIATKQDETLLRVFEQGDSSVRPESTAQHGQFLDTTSKVTVKPTEVATKPERKMPAPVKVSINVRPWGEIVINGVSRGVTPPLKTVMLRPGIYELTIRNSAREPYTTTLVVTADKPAVITHAFR